MVKRKVIHIVAAILIFAGLAMIGYPLYLRIQARVEQSRLEQAFMEQRQKYHIEAIAGKDKQQEPSLPKWDEFPPTQLEIPAVDLSVQVVAVKDMDVFSRKFNQPPSYYPESVFPGEVGNLLIAGHRGGPAGYFHKLFDLNPRDEIILRTPKADYFYEVEEVFSVEPTQVEVIAPLDYAAITLTTCQRVGSVSSAKRLIVRGKFVQAIPLPYE
ncbi:MAG: class E sortase [Firmicutes bacterium]|nr:class E sortase [Bacillota bacterium]